MKGNPQHMNRGLDCDVIVAEVGCDTINVDSVLLCCVMYQSYNILLQSPTLGLLTA